MKLPRVNCIMSGVGSIPGAAGGNPVVFFDISIGGHSAGRIKMEVRSPAPSPIARQASQCTSGCFAHSCLPTWFHAQRRTLGVRACHAVLRMHQLTFHPLRVDRQFCTGEFRCVGRLPAHDARYTAPTH